jgi:hypothetical protein
MSWYRTGTVVVTNGSKTVTGVGTLWTTAVNAGDAFALVDANLNPTGAWYEVDVVVSNTEITLKQSYAGTTGSNNQYCVFNMVGNMTTPSFAQRLATFFASFQSLIDKPTTTPTALGIPVADANGDIDSGWLKDASTTVKGVVELATSAETTTATDTTRAVTPAGFLAGLRGNLLGTVSQVGGVPTGAVIELGSNANGKYTKFADGTMICTSELLSNGAVTLSNGSVFHTEEIIWYFPAIFVGFPTTSGLEVNGAGLCWVARGTSSGEGGSVAKYRIVRGASTVSTPACKCIAIGRWL